MRSHRVHDDEDVNRVIAQGPCPVCHSPDNVKIYADGHEHCFSQGCTYHKAATHEGHAAAVVTTTKPVQLLAPAPQSDRPIRAIKPETRRRYGVFTSKQRGGKEVIVYPEYYQGVAVGQKLRTPAKDFPVLHGEGFPAEGIDCDMWGSWVYGDRFDRRVVVTEGEEDALAVAQVVDFKLAVVSVTFGAQSAKKCLQRNWRWLDRFSEIVLWFDDDEAGRAAMAECAPLFDTGKVKIAKAPGFKDANDALKAGKPGDITSALYAAQSFRPRGIINARDAAADMEEEIDPHGWEYPFKGMTDATLGMRVQEVTYHVAGTGVGKTTVLNQTQFHLMEQGVKVGRLSFEENRRGAQLSIMSIAAKRRLEINPIPKAELMALHQQVFGTGRMELFDPTTAEWSFEAIIQYIKYMAKALECKAVFVDPLSFIVAGLSAETDERRALDKVSMELAKASHELDIHLGVSHHLTRPSGNERSHEEGGMVHLSQVRGSGGVANFAMYAMGYERDLQGANPDLMQVRVLKSRKIGETGIAATLKFDRATGLLMETTEAWPEESGSRGSRGGGSSRKGSPPPVLDL